MNEYVWILGSYQKTQDLGYRAEPYTVTHILFNGPTNPKNLKHKIVYILWITNICVLFKGPWCNSNEKQLQLVSGNALHQLKTKPSLAHAQQHRKTQQYYKTQVSYLRFPRLSTTDNGTFRPSLATER